MSPMDALLVTDRSGIYIQVPQMLKLMLMSTMPSVFQTNSWNQFNGLQPELFFNEIQ